MTMTETTLSCASVLDGVPCKGMSGLAWVRAGCLHEHVQVYALCGLCRDLVKQRMMEMVCIPCDTAKPDVNGQVMRHACAQLFEGLDGELGQVAHTMQKST